MSDKQTQKAGDNSQLIQTSVLNVIQNGIDEKRAREICSEMYSVARNDLAREAFIVANTRVTEFENRLIPKMMAIDGALNAFSDPGFQLLLTSANKTAAATERPADYDLLSELLIHRVQKGEDRKIRAGISRAVEIVDEISDDALLGLTAAYAAMQFRPTSGDILQGLDVLDELFGKIIYETLPSGRDWLDHLDVLDAIRISSVGKLRNVNQYFPEILNGYASIGIEQGSENYGKAVEILKSVSLPINILLVNHALRNGYSRLPIVSKDDIGSLSLLQNVQIGGQTLSIPISLSDVQKDAVKSVYELYVNDDGLRNENISKLMEEWDSRPNLMVLKQWWDNIPKSLEITAVGKVLAHANAQRCDKSLPPLN